MLKAAGVGPDTGARGVPRDREPGCPRFPLLMSTALKARLPLLATAATAAALFVPASAQAATAGCASASAEPHSARVVVVRDATLCLLNAERRSRGLPKLRYNRRLGKAASR